MKKKMFVFMAMAISLILTIVVTPAIANNNPPPPPPSCTDCNNPPPPPPPPCTNCGDNTIVIGIVDGDSPSSSSSNSSSRSSSSASSDSNSEANANNELEVNFEGDEREFLPAVTVEFPPLIQSANLDKAGPKVRQAKTIVSFLPDGITPEQAKNGGETRYWVFSGKDISLNWLDDDAVIPEKQRSDKIKIVIAEEGQGMRGTVLGFPTADARRKHVESVDLIFSTVYEVWLRGGDILVVTAEGFERIRRSLTLGVGSTGSGSTMNGETGITGTAAIGISDARAWDRDEPWIQFTAIRRNN